MVGPLENTMAQSDTPDSMTLNDTDAGRMENLERLVDVVPERSKSSAIDRAERHFRGQLKRMRQRADELERELEDELNEIQTRELRYSVSIDVEIPSGSER